MWSDLNDLIVPSPIQEVDFPLLKNKNIRLWIKRDDLIHPWVSGNKYRKLKYNLKSAIENNSKTIVTFGGAFSNHLHATSGACALLGLKSVGIVRGEIDLNNPTIKFCIERGMNLIPVSRAAYRLKENSQEIMELIQKYPDCYMVPEGGTNQLALRGASEIVDEIKIQWNEMPEIISLACGTGGTTAGILSANTLNSKVIAFSALKTSHLESEIKQLSDFKNADKLSVQTDFHFGGYAKWNPELIDFIHDFEKQTDIPLDHVYNGKAMFGLFKLILADYFEPGSTICYIHTGGLQGKDGLKYMTGK
ncbi:MAG: 1-aminocyclopropane-1-carboxylate deaminase/D-cysteine desulfhydrase [Saprospiraceae bacterium]|nr:1-aminocyclopropane-1-carboxylate deaminase/D-cysteine desulfhydrase [Saprospiraceae bacterium]MBP6568503.1 1-aminocyclopropane-1-carboxylate deaminase/D-cysteine desulfhydrase [Saprospiraceae bacterium]